MNLSATPAWLVTSSRVLELHQTAMTTWGGTRGNTNTGCVEASIGNALSAAYYTGDGEEPDVLTVSVHLLAYLAKGHCFTDGNKRVAWMSFGEQLAVLGLDVDASNADVVKFVGAVATSEIGIGQALEWVASRLIALPSAPEA